MDRRLFLAAGVALTPLASLLSACAAKGDWPEGMQEIKWDRDTCMRCAMAISDRRFAAELVGGPQGTVFKFDDIGCVTVWMRDRMKDFPWMAEPGTRIWVADVRSQGNQVKWLDARKAQYLTKTSPMGYNFGAVALPEPGVMDFAEMRAHVLAKGR